jgi:chemotaxis response regulator CheB
VPLNRIVADLPADLGAAVFVVVHVGAGRGSYLSEVMGWHSQLPVFQASDQDLIAPAQICVAPSDHHLVVERGYVRLQRSPKDPWNRPSVNVLFRSAARAYGGSVAGVVLSGSLHDGMAGLWEIKAAGGVAIVQDPDDAAWRGMPQSASEAVDVDHRVPAAEIGSLLGRLAAPRSRWVGEGRRPRVLVVEDDAIRAIDLEEQLRSLGYEVMASVATGEDALRAAQDLPDLALVDIRLAGRLDGIETAGLLSERFNVGLICTTSHDDDETIRRLRATHPCGYLGKPLRSRDLHGAVEVALAARGFALGTRT